MAADRSDASKQPKQASKPRTTPQSSAKGREMPFNGDARPDRFNPDVLDKMVISLPLLEQLQKDTNGEPHSVIIDLNLDHPGGQGWCPCKGGGLAEAHYGG
jgi:hypothetical protein